MRALALLLLLAVAGCVPQYRWVKDGVSPEEANRDQYECERDMRAGAMSFGTGFDRETNAQAFMERCYRAKGYVPVALPGRTPASSAARRADCENACWELRAGDECFANCRRNYP